MDELLDVLSDLRVPTFNLKEIRFEKFMGLEKQLSTEVVEKFSTMATGLKRLMIDEMKYCE